jgi:hypothetical protein
VPEVQDISSADFDQIEQWRWNPPEPTKQAIQANAQFYALLGELSGGKLI